jgi:hypothetical protein
MIFAGQNRQLRFPRGSMVPSPGIFRPGDCHILGGGGGCQGLRSNPEGLALIAPEADLCSSARPEEAFSGGLIDVAV